LLECSTILFTTNVSPIFYIFNVLGRVDAKEGAAYYSCHAIEDFDQTLLSASSSGKKNIPLMNNVSMH
jgi:hypothetical protein